MSGGRPRGAKSSTRHGVEARVVIRWIVDRITAAESYTKIESGVMKRFHVSRGTAQRRIREARELFRQQDDTTLEERRNLVFQRLELCFRMAREKGDVRGMLISTAHYVRLCGAFDVERRDLVQVVSSDDFAARSTDDLSYYADNGHWPEDAPPPRPLPEPPSLERLIDDTQKESEEHDRQYPTSTRYTIN